MIYYYLMSNILINYKLILGTNRQKQKNIIIYYFLLDFYKINNISVGIFKVSLILKSSNLIYKIAIKN